MCVRASQCVRCPIDDAITSSTVLERCFTLCNSWENYNCYFKCLHWNWSHTHTHNTETDTHARRHVYTPTHTHVSVATAARHLPDDVAAVWTQLQESCKCPLPLTKASGCCPWLSACVCMHVCVWVCLCVGNACREDCVTASSLSHYHFPWKTAAFIWWSRFYIITPLTRTHTRTLANSHTLAVRIYGAGYMRRVFFPLI